MKYSRKVRWAATCAAVGSAAFVGLAAAGDSPSSAGVELPREVVAAASTFSAYMEKAVALNGQFTDGQQVAQALRTGVAYEPVQFQEGMIGYGALAALQDGRFVSGIEAAASQAGGRPALAERLEADPQSVLAIPGADAAALRVQAALHDRGAQVLGTGTQIKQAAYAIQHQAWSTVTVADGAGRLAEAKSLSASPVVASEADDNHLIKIVLAAPAPTGAAGGRPTQAVIRSLALAAEAELGAARNDDLPKLRPLLADRSDTDCLKMSKLNLYQCMAVAGPEYEDVFCLGQHALMDTGQCVARAAGESAPAATAAASPPTAAPMPAAERPFIVPVAQRSLAANGE